MSDLPGPYVTVHHHHVGVQVRAAEAEIYPLITSCAFSAVDRRAAKASLGRRFRRRSSSDVSRGVRRPARLLIDAPCHTEISESSSDYSRCPTACSAQAAVELHSQGSWAPRILRRRRVELQIAIGIWCEAIMLAVKALSRLLAWSTCSWGVISIVSGMRGRLGRNG